MRFRSQITLHRSDTATARGVTPRLSLASARASERNLASESSSRMTTTTVSTSAATQSRLATCPICFKHAHVALIDAHVERCLEVRGGKDGANARGEDGGAVGARSEARERRESMAHASSSVAAGETRRWRRTARFVVACFELSPRRDGARRWMCARTRRIRMRGAWTRALVTCLVI